jgi:hypothetical protein
VLIVKIALCLPTKEIKATFSEISELEKRSSNTFSTDNSQSDRNQIAAEKFEESDSEQ